MESLKNSLKLALTSVSAALPPRSGAMWRTQRVPTTGEEEASRRGRRILVLTFPLLIRMLVTRLL